MRTIFLLSFTFFSTIFVVDTTNYHPNKIFTQYKLIKDEKIVDSIKIITNVQDSVIDIRLRNIYKDTL